eukprot:CAMPEP_0170565312 /NCGR_PEP_ID=MMETSP0211-20121228/78072_1 /TAXON_ID=311385 /ORGANISM="Pseudokeronopsis sp., Strain OXSARD2" /LENGTH=38 /DNA_ID= /DNA_START= /DNA_END= /DNA_ORIENTATION=
MAEMKEKIQNIKIMEETEREKAKKDMKTFDQIARDLVE